MDTLGLRYRKIFLILILVLFENSGLAQRGGSYSEGASPKHSTTQGFPGYFDTNVAEPGSLVVEFPPMIYGLIPTPSAAIDYGVSETLTVGTNAIVTAVPWLFGARGFSLKVRSLVYGDENHQSAVTYYAGYMSSNTRNNFIGNYHVMTWNHAWQMAPKHTLFGHINYHRINLELNNIDDLNHAVLHLNTFLIGTGYEYTLTNRWSFRGDLLGSIYQNLEADTAAASINLSASVSNPQAATATMTAQVQYHPFDKWLFGLGATGLAIGGGTMAAPWFTWSKRW